MNNKNIPSEELKEGTIPSDSIVVSSNEVTELKAQMLEMKMEIDILKETINVLKKDPCIDQAALSNREKAVIIDVLKTKYSLPHLLKKLHISKSSYYYQEKFCFNQINTFPCEYISKNYLPKTRIDMAIVESMHCSNVKALLFLKR